VRVVKAGKGADRIFGGGALQDRLYIFRDDPFDITRSGKNVVITVEEGGRNTLLDVKFGHFDEADYSV
jgi:hypothetical protein